MIRLALLLLLAAPEIVEVAPGTRVGLVVTDMDGREIVAIAPDDRFVPASTTKIFTTAAAFERLADLEGKGGAGIRLEPRAGRAPDVVLVGAGDARLSSAPDCATDCLSTLADSVAAATRTVHDVVGDDSAFPDERWSPGMSWNNMATRSGTATSALTLDDNEWRATVAPDLPGRSAFVDGDGYYAIENRAVTGLKTALGYDRLPGTRVVQITGTVAAPETLRLGIEDPADRAAWRFRAMLVERGVRVTGRIGVRHRPSSPADDPVRRGTASPPSPPRERLLVQLTPSTLADDLTLTNKTSQNLHAELLLRRLGPTGSIADGRATVAAMMTRAGVPRAAWDFADGSGMSSYNRVSPRGVATFLRWTTTQSWGVAWRATLPVGGVDGTLARRFVGTPLAGRIAAKTGTLNAATGLAGFMTAASGRTLVFAAYAGDMRGDASATAAIDAALLRIAAAH